LRKILGNSQESFLGIRGNFQESFTGKSGENVDRKFVAKRSSEAIPGNFPGTIPKIFSRVPQEYLEIFTYKSSE